MRTGKSVVQLESHLKDLEKNSKGLAHKVSHFDLDLLNLERDLDIPEKLAVKLKTLDQSLLTLDEVLDVIEIIPQINLEVGELKEAVDTIKAPLHKAYKASSNFDAIVKPVRTAVAKLEIKIKALDREMNAAIKKVQKFTKLMDQTGQCLSTIPAGEPREKLRLEMDQTSREVDVVVKAADKLMILLMDSIDRINKEVAQIKRRLKPLQEITKPIDEIISKLNLIIGPLKALESALSHIISVPYEGYAKYCRKWGIPYPCGWHKIYFRFSVKEIISDLDSVVKPVEDLLNKEVNSFLKPIIKALHLKIKLPSIPGLGSLNVKLKALLGNFISLPEEVDRLLKKAAELEKEIDAIVEKNRQWRQMNETCNKNKK